MERPLSMVYVSIFCATFYYLSSVPLLLAFLLYLFHGMIKRVQTNCIYCTAALGTFRSLEEFVLRKLFSIIVRNACHYCIYL